jgi:hypothetical protein
MFAGRNISASHIAFASTRVMATCAVIGQGVGTAAALALREKVEPAAITARRDLMRAIQQQLLKDDCFLIGARNADTNDLVRSAAQITASSSQGGAEPEAVRSGITRIVTKLPQHRLQPGLHRWMSAPAGGLPAWLELRWNALVKIREVILIFDTGLHRLLTLSQADGYTQKMLWGRAQPETVRDYSLEIEDAGGRREIARIADNHQRRRTHHFEEAIETRALRIVIHATNGLDHARILEVRAYE